MWALISYVRVSHGRLATKLRNSIYAKTKAELITASRTWALALLLVYTVVLCCVFAWFFLQNLAARDLWIQASSWRANSLRGLYLGLAIGGLPIYLNRFFSGSKRFPLIIVAGAHSPACLQIATVLTLVVAEETWRALTLYALLRDGYSSQTAMALSAFVYAISYIAYGDRPVAGKAFMGAAFGSLILWQGSLLLVLCARLIFESQWVWFAVLAASNATPEDIRGVRSSRCPACGERISVTKLRSEGFVCPFCGESLSVSDTRVSLASWAWLLAYVPLILATLALFPTLQSDAGLLGAIFLACGFGAASLALLQSMFPPELQCGEPNFIGLNLANRKVKSRPRNSCKDPADSGRNSDEPSIK